jgi:NAD/NADP transhydrogenase alpha subunit
MKISIRRSTSRTPRRGTPETVEQLAKLGIAWPSSGAGANTAFTDDAYRQARRRAERARSGRIGHR